MVECQALVILTEAATLNQTSRRQSERRQAQSKGLDSEISRFHSTTLRTGC